MNLRQEKGITLIALVITIIVMLILVGVTITIAVNGGLFDYAKYAAIGTNEAKEYELGLANVNSGLTYDDLINKYTRGEEATQATYTTGTLIKGANVNAKIPEDAITVIFTDEKAPNGVETEDLTVEHDNSILAWMDENTKTYYITSGIKNTIIKANEDCSEMFWTHESKTGIMNEYDELEMVPQLKNIDLSNLYTGETYDMNGMFMDQIFLENIEFGEHFITSNVTNWWMMFDDCRSIQELDLSGFDTSKATNMNGMFGMNNVPGWTVALKTIYVSDKFDTTSVTSSIGMFDNCKALVGGEGTTYDANNITVSYAHVDGGISNPGYFTAK